jgi:hypothetical protein
MVPMSFFLQRTPAQPLAPYVESVWFCRNHRDTTRCYELDSQSDLSRVQARTSRSTSVKRRSRLGKHLLPGPLHVFPLLGRMCKPICQTTSDLLQPASAWKPLSVYFALSACLSPPSCSP